MTLRNAGPGPTYTRARSVASVYTCQALSPAFLSDTRVLRRERVPVLAMRLAFVLRSDAFAAQNVLCNRNWLKMCRVLARTVSAQMVDGQAVWDGAICQPPCDSVRSLGPMRSDTELPVASAVESQLPRPTLVWSPNVDFFPEAFCELPSAPPVVVSQDVLEGSALDPAQSAVRVPGEVGLLSAATPTEAVAVGPIVGSDATIGGVHWEFLSRWAGERRERLAGILCAPNYSTFTLSGVV